MLLKQAYNSMPTSVSDVMLDQDSETFSNFTTTTHELSLCGAKHVLYTLKHAFCSVSSPSQRPLRTRYCQPSPVVNICDPQRLALY